MAKSRGKEICRHRVKDPGNNCRNIYISLVCNFAMANLSFISISIHGGRKNCIENGNGISLTVLSSFALFMSRREDYCRGRMFGTRVRAITKWNVKFCEVCDEL